MVLNPVRVAPTPYEPIGECHGDEVESVGAFGQSYFCSGCGRPLQRDGDVYTSSDGTHRGRPAVYTPTPENDFSASEFGIAPQGVIREPAPVSVDPRGTVEPQVSGREQAARFRALHGILSGDTGRSRNSPSRQSVNRKAEYEARNRARRQARQG